MPTQKVLRFSRLGEFSLIQSNSFELLGDFSHINIIVHARGCGIKMNYEEPKFGSFRRLFLKK